MSEPLKLVSITVVDRLSSDIEANLDSYLVGDFSKLAGKNGWDIETSIASWDPSIVKRLDPAGTPEAEIQNSLVIYNGLEGVTAALARDERLWVRLCHMECLDFARARWLKSTDDAAQRIRSHFFAKGLPGCRDDNAIGRLWWNGHVAALACPDNLALGLELLLMRANNRLQIVDRADTGFRQPLVQGILRLLKSNSWLRENDVAIATFMKEVNKYSGSMIFEALAKDEIDAHLLHCLESAQNNSKQAIALSDAT